MENVEVSPRDEEPPTKRPRLLACRRCRARKQRCDESRPCSNCRKATHECEPTDPAPRHHENSDYVRALEERVAELETRDPRHNLDHLLRRSREASEHPAHAPPVTPIGQQTTPATDDHEALDHLILGLVTSPSSHRDGHAGSASGHSPLVLQAASVTNRDTPRSLIVGLPRDVEEVLLNAYRDRAQVQWPFFHWDTVLSWHSELKTCTEAELANKAWLGFFVNMIYATSFLLLPLPTVGHVDARSFYRTGMALLPVALRQANPILHVQAYLLLSMHALHSSSTERILSLASMAMRLCIQNQFYLAETEPEPTTPKLRLNNQIRRRCFWCAYGLDRLVVASFDLPPAIADVCITTRLYANIDDEKLLHVASQVPAEAELPDSAEYTCVSSALHILQCRRIQSEIASYTLRWDYSARFEKSLDWRIRIVEELEGYKFRVKSFSDPLSIGHTSQRWLSMIYHYTLLMLYRPTKESVIGPAGDWSVQASSQACLIFRRSQMDRQVAQSWLGVLVQLQSGVTLLYCFWGTSPEQRSENYDSPDVPDALLACSNILAIAAERWPKADCLRDVFELLAREVPLVDRPGRAPTRISETSAAAIRDKLPQVGALLAHRPTIRMINEMISDDFPRLSKGHDDGASLARVPLPVEGLISTPRSRRPMPLPQINRSFTNSPLTAFEMPFAAQDVYDREGRQLQNQGSLSDTLLAFPQVFDFNTWN
ncbi:fungal-specific transcription factor domain-containing protein [Xylariomycetidae sp. FL2044]|nr:fungal-specific transcription factor domain-containing protein [Xylariomycetidae sp. FL2044]